MFTYLLILLSAIALLVVFGRRMYLYQKKRTAPVLQEVPEEVAPPQEEEVKFSRADKEKLALLCAQAQRCVEQGNDDEAIKHFVQALSIDPYHIEAQDKLAMLYMQKQMFNAAAALFRQLAEKSENPVHFSHLGFSLYQQNELEQAKWAYQRSVELDPHRPQRFVSLAQVYRLLNQPHHALMAAEKALSLDEENKDFKFLFADLKREVGALEEALMVVEEILAADSGDEDAKALRKVIRMMLKELA